MNPYQAPREAENDDAQSPTAEPQAKAKFNKHTHELLRSPGPWQMFIGAWCLVATAGAFLFIPYVFYAASKRSEVDGLSHFGESFGTSLMFAIIGGIYMYPGFKLIASSRALKRLTQSRSADDLEAALIAQKNFWRFAGIGLILMIGLYAVVGLITLATAK